MTNPCCYECLIIVQIRLKVQHKAADIKFTVDPTFHTVSATITLAKFVIMGSHLRGILLALPECIKNV